MADVGPAGVPVVLGLPPNLAALDPETGLYWIGRDQPVRHLLQRIQHVQTVTLPDGFVALFEDAFRMGQSREDRQDVLVLRAQGERLALHRFRKPGLSGASKFAWLGGRRFVATFRSDHVVVFEVPEGGR